MKNPFRRNLAGQLCPRPVAQFSDPTVVRWPGTYEVKEDGKPGRRVRFAVNEALEGNGVWVYEE